MNDFHLLWSDTEIEGNVAWTEHGGDFDQIEGGWIPIEKRTPQEIYQTEAWYEKIGSFDEQVPYRDDIPERFIFPELEVAALGRLLPRIHQQTGSCVGAGAGVGYGHTQVGDIIRRGDVESAKLVFFPATYGVGRKKMGARGTGDGSYGGAQAWAVENFGMLPHDWDNHDLPDPTIKNGWAAWTARQEKQWSHPNAWPIKQSELQPSAIKFKMEQTSKINDVDAIPQALARGLGVTEASMYGTSPSVRSGVLLGPWNRQWAHQMNVGGYWDHPELGMIFLILNQWNNVHGICPALKEISEELGVDTINGAFWCPRDDMAKICSRGEVIAHAGTGGFDPPVIDWDLQA